MKPTRASEYYDSSDIHERLLNGARSIAPVLRGEAAQADINSQLTDKAADALRDAGLFRLGVPRQFGGLEASLATALEVIADVAAACPSSGWIVMLSYLTQQAVATCNEATRQDIWGDGPDKGMCGSFGAGVVAAHPCDGGIVVTGKWSWASGCHHADWAWLAVPGANESSASGIALIPLADLAIEKTWNMAGMRGTGSDTLVADGVFVPQHRIRNLLEFLNGLDDSTTPPLYRIPVGSMLIAKVGPLLGAAREVLGLTLATVNSDKPLAGSFYPRLADSPSVQAALADAANLIDSAHLHLTRSAAFLDGAAAAGVEPTLVERGRVRMDMAHACNCLREAVQLLLNIVGASGFRDSAVVQRYWRDVETAARHPMLNTGLLREVYGRALVGNEQPISPLL